MGTGGFGTLPGLVLAYYLTDTLGVAPALGALVVLLPKVWDVAIDPFVGALSDAEARRRSTRTRLVALGAVTLPVGFLGMFAVPTGLAPGASAVWVAVAVLARLNGGECFGEMALVGSQVRTATVRAMRDTVTMRFEREQIDANPPSAHIIYRNIARILASRLDESSVMLADLVVQHKPA